MMGPIDGKNYSAGYMAPAKSFGIERDDRLADLISYLRYAWGKEGRLRGKGPCVPDKKKASGTDFSLDG
jgi:hypothetical protein